MKLQNMYESFTIGNLTLKNRLVASAMFEYGADNGTITDQIMDRYRLLAEGGSGLIITGMHAVTAAGAVAPIMVNAEYGAYVSDLRALVAQAHANDAKLFVQLQHCGYGTFDASGFDAFGVCDQGRFHQATPEELGQVARDFASAAIRCKKAGVDGVQIHAAHGYLINTFLSPSTNHRTDDYGGPIEHRARLLFEVYGAIRAAVGKEYPIGVKFPFCDLIEHSITPEESLWTCRELERRGIDMIEVSSGMVMDGSAASFSPVVRKGQAAPFLEFAKSVADAVSIPVISVCGYRTPAQIESALAETNIAAVSFGRPLVREPNLPNRWKTDDSVAKCVSCNGCCNSFADGIITCQLEKRKKES